MLLQPYLAPASRVIVEPMEVLSRLQELDPTLDEDVLLEANMRGYEARLEATPIHAPTAAGTFHWHSFVPALHEALIQRGWTRSDYKNCPLIVSPDKSVMILIMTGNADTGRQFGNPANQADKGAVLDQAVQRNQQYELFENDAVSALKRGESGTQLWVLLYHVERGRGHDKEIRTELSLPSSFGKKKIAGWKERIILRSILVEPGSPVVSPVPLAPTEPIDVPVERRHAG